MKFPIATVTVIASTENVFASEAIKENFAKKVTSKWPFVFFFFFLTLLFYFFWKF